MSKVKLIIAFAGGAAAGLMLAICAWVYTGRPGVIGGETLILPLIVLLLYVGWEMGRLSAAAQMARQRRRRARSYTRWREE